MIGSGPGCEIRLQWNGVQALEATLEIGEESQVRLTVPGQEGVDAELPLNITIGERELTFFRPMDTHGWSEPVAGTEGGREITISCGGKAPLRRRLHSSSPFLIGSGDSCGAIVPGGECPNVAVAAWWRGGDRVLLQVLDNSAPVEWENRGEALEGEVELPFALSIAGKLVSAKASANAQTKLPTVEQEQPNRQPLSKQQAKEGKKSSWLVVAGVGVFAMLMTASAIHFLMSNKKDAAPVAGTLVAADSAAPNWGAPETLKSLQPAAETVSVPTPLVQSTPPQEPPAKPTSQPAAAAIKGPTTVAVLEFENSSKKEDMEPLRKGLRDMMMTDLSQVSSIKMVERGRLQDLLQEMKLAEGQFIDPATAAKLGKGLAATAVLTGSYLAVGENIRIDARMVKVETGEVIMAEQVAGTQDDFFTLQKVLAEKMVDRLDVAATPQEQLALRRPQTANFQAFTAYSRGVLALEKGEKGEARKELASAVQQDASFKLASIALDEVEKEAKQALAFLDKQIEDSARSIEERFDSQFKKYRELAEAVLNSDPEQLAAHIIVAVHYGLRGQYDKEQRHLLEFAHQLSKSFREQNSKNIYYEVRNVLIREVALLCSIAGKKRSNERIEYVLKSRNSTHKLLDEPAYSLLPPEQSCNGPSVFWTQIVFLFDPEFQDVRDSWNEQTVQTVKNFVTDENKLEFPSCWSLAAVQAEFFDLLDVESAHKREGTPESHIKLLKKIGYFNHKPTHRNLWIQSYGTTLSKPYSYLIDNSLGAPFKTENLELLGDILTLYSTEELSNFPMWKEDWKRVAELTLSITNNTSQIPTSSMNAVISALRHVATTSDDFELQKRANETLLKLVKSKR